MGENNKSWSYREKYILVILLSFFIIITVVMSYIFLIDYYKTEIDSLNAKITKLEDQKELISQDRLRIKEEKEKLEKEIESLNDKINELEESVSKNVVKNDNSVTVYITESGSKYHKSWCSYLNNSKIPISLNKAKQRGYTACSRCY